MTLTDTVMPSIAPMPDAASEDLVEIARAPEANALPHEQAERHTNTRAKLGKRAAHIPVRMPQVVRS